MSSSAATTTILLSALVIGGMYGWRWLTGGKAQPKSKLTVGKLAGLGTQVSPEGFLVAWGAVFMVLSLASTIAPQLAGPMALLITLGCAIANFGSVAESATGLVQAKTVGGEHR